MSRIIMMYGLIALHITEMLFTILTGFVAYVESPTQHCTIKPKHFYVQVQSLLKLTCAS